MKLFSSRKLSAGLFILLLLAIAFFSFRSAGTRRALQESKMREADLMQHISRLEQNLTAGSQCPLPTPETVRALAKKGFSPADLILDLQDREELIPFEGVLGGVMNFPDPHWIHVLTPRWVLAYFEDGHVAGEAFLEYRIENGRITWKLLDAFLL